MSDANAGSIKAKLVLESKEFQAGMKAARDEMEQSSSAAQRTSQSLALIQKGALAVGAAAVTGIGASVKVAANFEQSMAKVSAVSGVAGAEFKQLEDLARSMGETTQFSASESADALTFLAMSGMDATEMISALPNVLNLASAAGIDLASAADYVTNIMSGFGLAAEDTAMAVDVLTAAATSSNSTVPELAEGFKMSGPIAKELGYTLEETAAALGVLHDNGLKGSQSGTILRAALLSLANPAGQTADAIKDLGINVETADGKMKPLPELIGHIAEKTEHLTDKQKTQAVAQLVGTEAASGFLALMAKGQDDLSDYTAELEKSQGVAENVAKVQNDTVNGAFKEFQSALEGVGISVGREYLPVVREILTSTTDMVRWLGELNPSTIAMGLNFAGAASGIALAATTIVRLGTAIKGLMLAMGPTGWLIAGASLLGGLLFAMARNVEDTTEVNLELANSLSETNAELTTSIGQYEDLQRKSKLSNDEFARFLDIQTELNKAVDDSDIERLTTEQEALREKSGLSNEELQRMVGLNEALIEKVPESADRITEQGNRVVETTGYLRDYNEELAGATMRELERQRLIAQSNEREIRKEIVDLQNDLNEGRAREAELADEIKSYDEGSAQARLEEIDLQLQSNDLSVGKQTQLIRERHEIENKLDTLRDELATQMETNDKNEIAIEQKQQELGLADEIAGMMADQLLEQMGINDAKGEGIEKINEAIAKEEESISQLRKLQEEQGGLNADVDNEISRRQENIRKLETTRGKVNDLVGGQAKYNDKIYEGYLQAVKLDDSLSVKDYLKKINVTDGGTLAALEARMKRPVSKTLNIKEQTLGKYGIKYHQGGLIGKQSGTLADIPKLHNGGTASQFLRDMPMHNEVDVRLLKNEMVLTEGQQSNLFRMLQGGQTATSSGNSPDYSPQMLGLLRNIESAIREGKDLRIELDGYEVGRGLEPYVGRKQAEDFAIQEYTNGGDLR